MSKTYHDYRRLNAEGHAVQVSVSVLEPGLEPRPLDPRLDLRRHSPDGFEWGYGGSGPAQLALALAADVLGDDERAYSVYQELKRKLVSILPYDGWSLSADRVRQVIAGIEHWRQGGIGMG
jgi:hypothetical protein